MKKEKKEKENSFAKKIIGTICFVILILYCVKCMSLNFFGVTTNGIVTETTQRYSKSDKNSSKRYTNTAYYYFFVGNKKYTGHVSYKTNYPIVKKEDQKQTNETVQYLKTYPTINTLKKYNSNSIFSTILWFILIGFGVFGIILINKKGGKDKAIFKEGEKEDE